MHSSAIHCDFPWQQFFVSGKYFFTMDIHFLILTLSPTSSSVIIPKSSLWVGFVVQMFQLELSTSLQDYVIYFCIKCHILQTSFFLWELRATLIPRGLLNTKSFFESTAQCLLAKLADQWASVIVLSALASYYWSYSCVWQWLVHFWCFVLFFCFFLKWTMGI